MHSIIHSPIMALALYPHLLFPMHSPEQLPIKKIPGIVAAACYSLVSKAHIVAALLAD